MGTLFGIGVVIVIMIIVAIYKSRTGKKESELHEGIFNRILNEKGFTPDQIIFTSHNQSRNCISVNEANKKVSVGYTENNILKTKDYNFSDVVSFEIQIDDKSSNKISIGGALAGAAIGGGIGAVIGAKSGNQTVNVRDICMLITFNSISDPIFKFSILPDSYDGKGWSSDNVIVQKSINTAEKWTGIFKVIMKNSEL